MKKDIFKPTNGHKLLFWLGIITNLLLVIIIFMIVYWLVYPYPTATSNSPYKTDRGIYKAGDIVTYYAHVCRVTNKATVLDKSLINDFVYHYAQQITNVSKGCKDSIVKMEIPKYVPTGSYRITIDSHYRANPLRIITNHYETVEFRVVGAEDLDKSL